MFSNKIRKSNRRKISIQDICNEVKALGSGEVMIVKTAPGIPTLDLSVKSTLLSDNPKGKKILFHSMKTADAEVAERLMDIRKSRLDSEQEQIHLNDELEFNVYKEQSTVRPDLYVIDAAESIGARAHNSDELAHDLLVYYAVKYNTAIVAYVKSRTALGGDADYEYDIYGRELEMPLEGARNTSFPDWPQAFHCANYYERKIVDKFNDMDYYMEFRRLLSKFKRLLELKDTFVRKSLKGCCFENVYELDEELERFESAHPDKTPLFTKHFVEQMHTQMEFFGDRTGWLRHYFGLGVKPESFRKARLLAGTFFELKSSISSISHLFIRVAENYLSELRSREEGIKKDSAKY